MVCMSLIPVFYVGNCALECQCGCCKGSLVVLVQKKKKKKIALSLLE
jgi:hypothetical protein